MLELEPLRLNQAVKFAVDRAPTLECEPFQPKGMFHIEHYDKDGNLKAEFDVPNGITDVGLNHILDTEFHGSSQVTTWYIGLIDNASFSALAAGDTMGSHAGWIENSDYDEAARVAWTEGAASGRSITNATTCDFTMNATKTIKGIFITSVSTKGGTTGVLWSTAAFGSTVAVVDNDVLKVTYTLSG